MATNVGRVGIVMKGAWSSSPTYETLDAVSYNNGFYIAKQDVPANTAPTNTTYWQEAIKIEFNKINVSDCSTIKEIYNALKNNPLAVGTGSIGALHNTNLKTLLTSPSIGGNYTGCWIRIVADFDNAIVMEVNATGQSNSQVKMAKKNLWLNGANQVESQSAWTIIDYTT